MEDPPRSSGRHEELALESLYPELQVNRLRRSPPTKPFKPLASSFHARRARLVEKIAVEVGLRLPS
jgi:hypothetical protein